MRLQLVGTDVPPGPHLHEGHDPLAEPLVVDADHQGVGHGRVALQRCFDLVGKDLLPSGVDAQRTSTEHGDRPVRRPPWQVAGKRPPGAVLLDEGGGGGIGVAEVAERDVATTGQVTDHPRPGHDGLEVGVEHSGALVDPQPGRTERVVGRRLAADLAGLGRAEPVGHDAAGQQLGQLRLGRRGQHGAARADGHQRRQVVAVGVRGQDVEQRTGHGVAHHHDGVGPLGLDQSPHLDRVESAVGRGDDGCRPRRGWRTPASARPRA